MPLRKKLSYVYTNISTTNRHSDSHSHEVISPKAIAFQFMLKHFKKNNNNNEINKKKAASEDIEIEKEEKEENEGGENTCQQQIGC